MPLKASGNGYLFRKNFDRRFPALAALRSHFRERRFARVVASPTKGFHNHRIGAVISNGSKLV
jgi:hypothetical protein